jgi:hypothetical protein
MEGKIKWKEIKVKKEIIKLNRFCFYEVSLSEELSNKP